MKDDILDIYDDNLKSVGTMPYGEVHATGAWHRTFHCWIVSGRGGGHVLFQKRSATMRQAPNLLDITAAGHYRTGETSQDGVREVEEELGLRVVFSQLVPVGVRIVTQRLGEVINREFCDVYVLRRDVPPAEYRPNPEEVGGLVQVRVGDGLALFSGARRRARVQGIGYDRKRSGWVPVRGTVGTGAFVARFDSYYYALFVMGEALLKGSEHLTI